MSDLVAEVVLLVFFGALIALLAGDSIRGLHRWIRFRHRNRRAERHGP